MVERKAGLLGQGRPYPQGENPEKKGQEGNTPNSDQAARKNFYTKLSGKKTKRGSHYLKRK